MQNCEGFQDLLFDYQYDLVDEADRTALQAHLAGCADCQAALARVRKQQSLFATAAKMEFPEVRFVQPGKEAGEPVLPLARPAPTRLRRWRQWAAAAAMWLAAVGLTQWVISASAMLVLFAMAGTIAWFASDYASAQGAIESHEGSLAQLDRQLQEAQVSRTQLAFELAKKESDIEREFLAKQLRVVVTGPATVEPGARANYHIAATDLKDAPTAADITVQLMNGEQKLSEPIAATAVEPGLYNVSLPADLPVQPGTRLAVVVSAKRENGPPAEIREDLQLVAAPVYLTYLTTDKPMYQPGEFVYFRSLTLERATLKPAQEDLRFHCTLTTPKGEKKEVLAASNRGVFLADDANKVKELSGFDKKPVRGIAAGDVFLDDSVPGGEYSLTLWDEHNRFSPQERKFLVNRYQKPQLNKELNFNRQTYGAGDEVVARCKATDTKNSPLRHQRVEASLRVDGKNYDFNGKQATGPLPPLATDDDGYVNVRFKLPNEIERGLASLSVNFNDGANDESIIRPVPLVLKKLSVEFCPEGGDLIANLENRVYFQARTPLDKPADLRGRLLEDGAALDVTLATLNDDKDPGVNQGMGAFTFTPKTGKKYEVQVDSPAGIAQRFALPTVRDDGVVLAVDRSVVGADQPINVRVTSAKPRSLIVGAYCRGQLLDTVRLEKGKAEAELRPAIAAGGVCRVTVFEELPGVGNGRREVRPVAERLIYREPTKLVKLAIHADQSSYLPGQKAHLRLEAADENDDPIPALGMLAVADKRVLTMADEKTYRSMPTQFLLTNEVRHPEDLEFADFLLSPKDKARQALDLLLGTQGWRRFAEQDPVKFRDENKDKDAADVERLVSAIGQSQPIQTDFQINQVNQARQSYVESAQRIDEVETRTAERRHAAAADVGYIAAIAKLARYRAFFNSVNHWIFPGLGVLLFAGTAVSVLVGLRRSGRRALPYFATGVVCALVLVVVGLEIILGTNSDRPSAAGSQPGNMEVANAKGAPTAAAPQSNEGLKFDGKDRFAGMASGKATPGEPLNKTGQIVDPKSASQPVDDRAEKPTPAPASVAPAALPAQPDPANQQGAARFHGPMAMKDTKPPAGPLENLDKTKGVEKERDQRKLEMHFEMPAAQNGPDLRKGDALAKEGDFKRVNEDLEQRRKPTPPIGLGNGGRGGVPGGGGFGGGPMPLAQPPGEAGGKPGEGKKQMAAMRPLLSPVVVREYRHTRPASQNAGIREDFAETLYWHPVLLMANGKAEASFDLCDSVTTFQATAFAHTLDGRLGATTTTFDARLPFTLEPKVPVEVTSSDKIDIPLSIANNGNGREKVNVQVAGMSGLSLLRGKTAADYELPAGQQMRQVYRFQPTVKEGRATLTFAGQSGAFTDNTKNSFAIVPEGFPVVGSYSDLLEKTAAQTVTLPQQWVAGTLKMQVDVYPSTLADLQKGLDALLREPNGCFEQTSTSNYPNLLILDYLKESGQTKPDVERRARDLLARGYQKLRSFECTNEVKKVREGYEWFGGTAPAHEALTAYGLLQFRDMARVQDVDQQMMERTKQYLLSRRDGKGGFTRNPRALDTFGRAPDDITNAYIVWSLTESGKDDDLAAEQDALIKIAESSKDPYLLSLVANGLINRDRRPVAATLLKKVADCQKDDGHLDAERTSITGSGGRDLQIETTALAVLGWLKLNSPGEFTAPVQKAVKWLGQQRGGYGGFGSTQSTILALKALIAYTKENKRRATAGELKLYVNEREVSKLPVAAGASDTLTLIVPNAEAVLRPGSNKVRVEITGRNTFPYTLRWNYSTLQPVSAEDCPVFLGTTLSQTQMKEGESVRLNVQLENKSGKGQGMAVAVVGLPGGLTLPEDMKQLKEYTNKPVNGDRPLVSAFDIRGRELILYWRDLAPDQKIELPLDLIARVPGEYSGPASRAYLYYNSDLKHWVEPLKVTIAAKE